MNYYCAVILLCIFKVGSAIEVPLLDKVLPLASLGIGIGRVVFARGFRIYMPQIRSPRVLVGLLLVVLISISILRNQSFLDKMDGNIANALIYLLLIVYTFLFWYRKMVRLHQLKVVAHQFVSTTVKIALIYCLINLISLFILPMKTGEGSYLILGAFGIHAKQLLFPMLAYSHPMIAATLAGTFFTMFVSLLLFTRAQRIKRSYLIIALALSLGVMLLGDSRSVFLFSFLTIAVLLAEKKLGSTRLSPALVLLIPFLQIIIFALLQALSHSDIGRQFSRSDNDLTTGNSRTYLTEASLEALSDFEPDHLIGYGKYGSYVSLRHAIRTHFHRNNESGILQSSITHNAFLQSIFDTGYLGCTVFIVTLLMLVSARNNVYRIDPGIGYLLKSFVLFYVLTGITESQFGNYTYTTFPLFIAFLAFFMATENYYASVSYNQARYGRRTRRSVRIARPIDHPKTSHA